MCFLHEKQPAGIRTFPGERRGTGERGKNLHHIDYSFRKLKRRSLKKVAAIGSSDEIRPRCMAECAITSASLLDVSGVMRLERICFGEDAWPLLDVIGMLSWPGEVRLKAVVGRRIVGFVAGEADETTGVSQIATIGVDPEYRRRGIGEALLALCEQSLPGHKLQLTVLTDNMAAIRLYEKFGYHAYARLEHYYRNGKAGTAMEKMR
jgi:ribosomal protein S18 acetylase RimI-like enzyme